MSPEAISSSLLKNHAPIEQRSLESALRALKDVERLAAGLQNAKSDTVQQTVDELRTQLKAAVKREANAIAQESPR